MCSPAAIPYIVSAVVVAAAGYQEARAQKRAGEANAKIAENNARLAEAQGKDEANLSAREQQQAEWRTRALIGQQRASIAANMLDPTQGTTFDLLGETALLGGAEQSALAMEGARKAWGFQQQALNFSNEGAQAKWMGKTQSRITMLRTIGSTISAASGAFSAGGSGATGTLNASGGSAYTPYASGYHTGYGITFPTY